MTAAIRLFIAVALGTEARTALQEACGRLRETVPFARWSHPADYHATVKFIGDVEPALAERLAEPVGAAVRGAGPFELSLGSFGSFGRGRAPSILWCGLGGGTDSLRALHERVEDAAAACGVAKEMRPFRAHITVARNYSGAAPFTACLERLAAETCAPHTWRVEELILYRTNFGKRPAYEALQRFPLA